MREKPTGTGLRELRGCNESAWKCTQSLRDAYKRQSAGLEHFWCAGHEAAEWRGFAAEQGKSLEMHPFDSLCIHKARHRP